MFLKDRAHARRGAGPVGRPKLGPEEALGSQLVAHLQQRAKLSSAADMTSGSSTGWARKPWHLAPSITGLEAQSRPEEGRPRVPQVIMNYFPVYMSKRQAGAMRPVRRADWVWAACGAPGECHGGEVRVLG